jgi:fatty-acyl-CoA synthase
MNPDSTGLFDRLKSFARFGAATVDFVRASGVVGAMRPKAALAFARRSRGAPRGPSLVIRLHALNTPQKLALVDGDVRLSYAELDGRVNRLAHGLHALGVGPGKRVAVMMQNRHEYLEAQWAIARLGAIVVQIGYRLKAAEVAYILGHCEPEAFLIEAEHAAVAFEAIRRANFPTRPDAVIVAASRATTADTGAHGDAAEHAAGARAWEAVLAGGRADEPPAVSESDGAGAGVMIYTSGTTGRPKGAARDFRRTLHHAVADFLAQVRFRHDDRHLVVCPLYHSAAPAFMAFTFMFGGTCVLDRGHFDPEQVLATIERERITTSFMVPTMLGRLAAVPAEVRARYDTSSLRWLLSGAAPLPTETARRVEACFGAILYNFYGSTETGIVTMALPGEHTARPGTIGRALLGNEIRLLDDEGLEVEPGQAGELWVRNTMLVAGYHKDQGATDKARRGGFFSVGDVARVDADGYYYLADRKADMVISGGVNIYPQEIEQHLHTHPAVLEVAVVGVPDPDWGESPVAYVVVRPGHAVFADELRGFCRDALADYKCPRRFELIDALPRNPTGKVLKRELRERARVAPDGGVGGAGGAAPSARPI